MRKPRTWEMENPRDLGWAFITALAYAAALVKVVAERVKR